MTLDSIFPAHHLTRQRNVPTAMNTPSQSLNSWLIKTGYNIKNIMNQKLGVGGRNRLPSIEEMHPSPNVPKVAPPAHGDFSRMFMLNDNAIFVKRRTPSDPEQQHHHHSYRRQIKDKITRHSLSEANLRSRVEPASTEADRRLSDGTFDTVNMWPSPAADESGVAAISDVRPSASIIRVHREKVTIDGKVRRVRFLSADHTPLTEDSEDQKVLVLKHHENAKGFNSRRSSQKSTSPSRSAATSSRRKPPAVSNTEIATGKANDHKETPDVWLERARKLRASKDSSNSKTDTKPESKQSETLKIHDNDNEHEIKMIHEALSKTSKHVNFCDEKKTEWIVKWLEEVNQQTHFDIIE
ncbi:uncharacterized protein [Diadema setosum]|uniref:uncharacterized protein n=1 Tax=Diadema setosum TaxID=31175 RepID=UPI003B39FC06